MRLRGSGLRALIALRVGAPDARLHTAVAASEEDELRAVTGAFGNRFTSVLPRTMPVTFSYFTPVSSPAIDGLEARTSGRMEADEEVVLKFGMIETGHQVQARCHTLVLDPQGETGFLDIAGATFERLAVVANEREVRRLGQNADVVVAACRMRALHKADAVVVKCGARGSIVVGESGTTLIGPRPTKVVRPIGSGDVFSAAFALMYGLRGADAVEAARAASDFTALFVSDPAEPAIGSAKSISSIPFRDPVRVYLAGPFFGLGQFWLVDLVCRALLENGAIPFSPFHDVGIGGPEVAGADLDGLDSSASVLALLDGFDPGTVFEIGYAARSGKPVVAYLDPRQREHLTMLEGTGVEVTDDLSTAVYRAIWAAMGTDG